MFLIRTAFWLILLIFLLPANEQEQQKIYGTAGAAVRDVKTFCLRNPDVCQKSSSLFDTFTQKAQFGAKLVMDFVKEASSDSTTTASHTATGGHSPFGRRKQASNGQNTLKSADLQPAWQGPTSDSGI